MVSPRLSRHPLGLDSFPAPASRLRASSALSLFLLAATVPSRAAWTEPPLPPIDYHPEEVGGIGKWHIHAPTLPGWHYQLEQLAADHSAWQPVAFWYGNGTPIKHFVTDGPLPSTGPAGPPPSGSPTWQLRRISFILDLPAAGADGPVRLSREAASYPGTPPVPVAAWDEMLSGQNLPPMAAGTRHFLFQSWDDPVARIMWHTQFQVTAHASPASVPGDSLPATAQQPAELAVYDQIKTQLIGGMTAPPSPAIPYTPADKKLLRLRRTPVDTNLNGLPDWWELAHDFQPFALAGQTGYFDPAGDTDGDGLSNLAEFRLGTTWNLADTDGDGSPDGQDTDALLSNVHPPVFDTFWRGMGGAFSTTWKPTTREPLQTGWANHNWSVQVDFTPSISGWTTPGTARSQLEHDIDWPAEEFFVLATALPDLPEVAEARWHRYPMPAAGPTDYASSFQVYERKFRARRDFGHPWEQRFTLLRLILPPAAGYQQEFNVGSIDSFDLTDLVIPPDLTVSPALELRVPDTDAVWNLTMADPEVHRRHYFTQLHRAPETLPVNSNFDEGIIDPATGYAKPDSSDTNLKADRDIPWKQIKAGDLITTDLHQGWFGLRPDAFRPGSPSSPHFYQGASIKIKKLARTDPDTDAPESGHVKFWVTQGDGEAAGAWSVDPYDRNDPAFTPTELTGLVYGPGATVPAPASNVRYWIEGLTPGKCTLEFKCLRGPHTITHTQTFLVATQKAVQEWSDEVRDQLLLQTYAKDGNAIDLDLYHTGNGFRNTTPSSLIEDDNTRRIQTIYYYYRQLFQQKPEVFMWAGMAKTSAAPIYAGMSDLTSLWQVQEAFGGYGAGTYWLIRGLLCGGQKAICTDMAWAHHAYQASDIWALNWARDNGENGATDFTAWNSLRTGVTNQIQSTINSANQLLLQREQRDVVQEYYHLFATTKWMSQPKSGAAWLDTAFSWFLRFEVATEDPGLGANVGEWLSANSLKNPMPGGPSFRSVVPGGRIDNYNDRWAWTNNASNGMLQIWTGTATDPGTPNFDAAKRMLENNKTMFSGAAAYSFDPVMLPFE